MQQTTTQETLPASLRLNNIPTLEQLNPYIRIAMPSVLPAGREIFQRVIFDYELIYIEKGTFSLDYDHTEYICREGHFILIRPGIPHRFYNIHLDVSQPHIHFDMIYTSASEKTPISFKDIPDFSREELQLIQTDIFAKYPAIPFVTFPDTPSALKLFYELTSHPQNTSGILAKARLLELLDMMIRSNFPDCFLPKKEVARNVSRQLKEYIDAGQGITARLPDLEKQFSYSKYHLDRLFKKEYGVSLIAYRNEKRMHHARELLREMRVSDVAEQLGFSSIYSFSRAYKNYFGVSPSNERFTP